jgi:phosphatidylglycerol:prolipoprotein diacylglycerol transferase
VVQPVLFELFGIHVTGYGVSKALAALAAGYLLAREFRRLRWDPDQAWNLVLAATILGFAGGKLYYVAEHLPNVTAHHWGPAGFTWYGGLIAGVLTILVMARRYRLPVQQLAGVAAAPLSLAYGIGRVGCFLAGDGSYGQPSDLPWAVAFPNGMVPTLVPVHPTALYEAAFAFLLAAFLWTIRTRFEPLAVFGIYAVLSGGARFLVEELRLNNEVVLGLTQPQAWSLLLVAVGIWLLLRTSTSSRKSDRSSRDGVPAVADAA